MHNSELPQNFFDEDLVTDDMLFSMSFGVSFNCMEAGCFFPWVACEDVFSIARSQNVYLELCIWLQ